MNHIPRLYEPMLSDHLKANRQMAFVSGPRQVGKTTIARRLSTSYQSWDAKRFRDAVLAGAGGLGFTPSAKTTALKAAGLSTSSGPA